MTVGLLPCRRLHMHARVECRGIYEPSLTVGLRPQRCRPILRRHINLLGVFFIVIGDRVSNVCSKEKTIKTTK